MSETPYGHYPVQPLREGPLQLTQEPHQPTMGGEIPYQPPAVGEIVDAEIVDEPPYSDGVAGGNLGMAAPVEATLTGSSETQPTPDLGDVVRGLQTLGEGMDGLNPRLDEVIGRLGPTPGAEEDEGPRAITAAEADEGPVRGRIIEGFQLDLRGKKPYGEHTVFETGEDGKPREDLAYDSNGNLIDIVDIDETTGLPKPGQPKRFPVKARATGVTDRPEALNPDGVRRPPIPGISAKGVVRVAPKEAPVDEYAHPPHLTRRTRAARFIGGIPGTVGDFFAGALDIGGDKGNRLLTEADVARMNAETRANNTPLRDPKVKPKMDKTGRRQRGASFVSPEVNATH